MYLSHLSLTNFRNIRQLEWDLPASPIVLVGANAQGKTSLLEAIYLLAIARSFRADNEREVVNWEAAAETSHAMVSGIVERKAGRERVAIGYQCVPSGQGSSDQGFSFSVRKHASVSHARRTASELVGLVNAVLFSADDLQLVYGPPAGRRRYLDVLLSQGSSTYIWSLQRYQRVVHQRNQLLRMLREGRAGHEELSFWDEELVKEGSVILVHRLRALAVLSQLAGEIHSELTDESTLNMAYKSALPLPTACPQDEHAEVEQAAAVRELFTSALERSHPRELATGSTMVGPHRDDLRLLVGQVDMGTYASRGQARTIALSLRLAEAAYLSSLRGDGPIVLLDDVLSELDAQRRAQVLRRASSYQQVIITTTDLEPLGREFLDKAACFRVVAGHVMPL